MNIRKSCCCDIGKIPKQGPGGKRVAEQFDQNAAKTTIVSRLLSIIKS